MKQIKLDQIKYHSLTLVEEVYNPMERQRQSMAKMLLQKSSIGQFQVFLVQ